MTPIPEVTPAPPAEAPETISPPEVTEAPEKGTATEAPETEAPETEVPEAGTPETEAPETEEPETEEPETETPETEAPETEIPEETEEPDVSAEPEPEEEPDIAWDPDETEPDIIENVDLDAEVYEEITAAIALNESDGPLEFVTTEDGVPLTANPRLSRNGNRIRVSLDDLCECVEKWKLTDDGVGSVVLEAAGYTLVIYNEDSGCSATVDGKQISMKDDDFDFMTDGHFIDAEFLASALKGEAVWEEEENTLMLRIRDREAVESAD